jgi:hypothetical protein
MQRQSSNVIKEIESVLPYSLRFRIAIHITSVKEANEHKAFLINKNGLYYCVHGSR